MTSVGGGSGPNLPAVEAWFIEGTDLAALATRAREAGHLGAGAVVVSGGPLGDPLVLAGALATSLSGALVGVHLALGESGRHPSVLARDMTTLDLVCDGRSLLCLAPPFPPGLPEALALCQAMWRHGVGKSDGPHYRVPGAVNRPAPRPQGGPRVALDLATGATAPAALEGLVDFVARPGPAVGVAVLEPA